MVSSHGASAFSFPMSTFAALADSLQKSAVADALAVTTPTAAATLVETSERISAVVNAGALVNASSGASILASFDRVVPTWTSLAEKLASLSHVSASVQAIAQAVASSATAASSFHVDSAWVSQLSAQWMTEFFAALSGVDAFGSRTLGDDVLLAPRKGVRSGRPENLKGLDLDDDDVTELSRIASEEGIAFAFALDEDTVLELLRAATPQERRRILVGRRQIIGDHCEQVLRSLRSTAATTYVRRVLPQIDALRNGYEDGAQALLTTLLDNLFKQRGLTEVQLAVKQHRSGKHVPRERMGLYLVVPALAKIFEPYPAEGVREPRHAYSRHATSHGLDSDTQLSTANAVAALVAVTSFLSVVDADVVVATHQGREPST